MIRLVISLDIFPVPTSEPRTSPVSKITEKEQCLLTFFCIVVVCRRKILSTASYIPNIWILFVLLLLDRNTLEPTGSSSLPPSPRHFSPPFSGVLSRESSKSVTVPTVKGSNVSGPSLPPPTCAEATSSMNWFRSDSATRLSRSGHRSPSLSKLNRSSGVVVVCSGPMRRMRSTGSLDSAVYSSSRTDASSLELKRLRQIPTFEPLIARSAANRGSSHSVISPESSSSRRVDVSLPRVAPEEVSNLKLPNYSHFFHNIPPFDNASE